ncbi:hypothetical protein L7F22_006014 [Adiantum nelumboides]|nr:hypothetical protein [Adiantum nelumboides]
MESCPETEQCSSSNPNEGQQAVRAIRVSKVVTASMLNANYQVSAPINLSNQVLSLLGFVSKHPLNVLVDSGYSTNFVSTTLANKLRLPTQQSVEAFQVELADGPYLQCNKKVQQLKFQIQNYQDQLNFSVMSLSHHDMIFGQSWLYQYDPIISFRDHSIRLYHDNQELELPSLFNTTDYNGICYASEAFGQSLKATVECVWLKRLMADLGVGQDTANTIYTDSQSALAVARNPIFHARTKHIEVHYHYVRERLSAGKISLAYVPTQDNFAHLFTKALSREKLEAFRKALGLLPFVD